MICITLAFVLARSSSAHFSLNFRSASNPPSSHASAHKRSFSRTGLVSRYVSSFIFIIMFLLKIIVYLIINNLTTLFIYIIRWIVFDNISYTFCLVVSIPYNSWFSIYCRSSLSPFRFFVGRKWMEKDYIPKSYYGMSSDPNYHVIFLLLMRNMKVWY